MSIRIYIKALCLLSLLLMAGCLSVGVRPDRAHPVATVDSYTLNEGFMTSTSGCAFHYRHYQPTHPITPTSIILGHGFLRDQDKLIDMSRKLANSGITVATLNFCNMRPWNGHHRRNAIDMRLLAERLNTADDVVFAGFSAGALAAILAADGTTKAVLTLDLVDQNALGLIAAQQLDIPLLGLHGPSHRCNANNNGLAIFETKQETATEWSGFSRLISNASHCEFESPSNWLCETACGDAGSAEADQLTRESIIKQTLELLRPHLSSLPNAASNLKAL